MIRVGIWLFLLLDDSQGTGQRNEGKALTDQDTGNEEANHVEEITGDQRTSSTETVNE